jgi:hypothetical protein
VGAAVLSLPGERWGVAVPEFMFRNLSVKLFPAEGDALQVCQDRTTQVVDCSPWQTACGCTNLCTGTFACQQLCSATPSRMIACDPTTRSGDWLGPHTEIVLPADADPRQELALLKDSLQKTMAVVEAKQADLERAAKPTSVEQIDELKTQLLSAVAELDEQRARMAGGGPAAAEG